MKSLVAVAFAVSLFSCTTSGPSGIFGKRSPHELYGDKIKQAGLQQTALGSKWFDAANKSLTTPLNVSLPYSETGYFPAENPKAVGLRFSAKRGEKLNIQLSKNPTTGFSVYVDLWEPSVTSTTETPKLLTSADSTKPSLEYEVKKDGNFILRLQPELLKSGDYTLSITTGPSLAFPVTPKVKSNVGSFWGVDRDGGARRHEGIDIFAPKRTPLVSAADGVVTRVNETAIGGKVVWLNPDGRDYSLYYAHLDEQLVQAGQRIKEGETVGLMGNTGNAKSTSPHLHFGIYAVGGAVDPLPFVNVNVKEPDRIVVPISTINKMARVTSSAKLYDHPSSNGMLVTTLEPSSLVQVEAATSNWYKVALPDGTVGYVAGSQVALLSKPIRSITANTNLALLDQPSINAPKKAILANGKSVQVLAAYKDFYYVSSQDNEGWISKGAL
ncbi:MAG: hypothetical protein JWQ96_1304 [Segetibacter sp.]|nr:hypothetical protein [Segetibacter sp.]